MTRRVILLILALGAACAQPPAEPVNGFWQKPYLQLGDHPKLLARERALAVWHAEDRDSAWTAEVRSGTEKGWRTAQVKLVRTVAVPGTPPHRIYAAELNRLTPGQPFQYRIGRNGQWVFESGGTARRPPGETHTFAVMGDIAQASAGQKAVAHQMSLAKPEYLVQVGDVVYGRGRVTEYYEKYFPILNADQAAADAGGPVLRSTLTLSLPGNHDIATKVDLGSPNDYLAYFYYWLMPLNGPVKTITAGHVPEISGAEAPRNAFLKANPAFPQLAMYSLDYGDAHWIMLDSNQYVDWTDPKLREWVRNDLRAARKSAWKFVGVHHPPFQSSRNHFNDQWIRLLSDIFEQEGVDVVFSGHVHNYQRTRPIRFAVKPEEAQPPMKKGKIDGTWQLDQNYDGLTKTEPQGVIWIVTGAGGAGLYNKEQEADTASWQPFTVKFISTVHSFTLATISPTELTVRQIDQSGREVDRFRITKTKR